MPVEAATRAQGVVVMSQRADSSAEDFGGWKVNRPWLRMAADLGVDSRSCTHEQVRCLRSRGLGGWQQTWLTAGDGSFECREDG